MKKILIPLFLFSVVFLISAAPPILRQFGTTNTPTVLTNIIQSLAGGGSQVWTNDLDGRIYAVDTDFNFLLADYNNGNVFFTAYGPPYDESIVSGGVFIGNAQVIAAKNSVVIGSGWDSATNIADSTIIGYGNLFSDGAQASHSVVINAVGPTSGDGTTYESVFIGYSASANYANPTNVTALGASAQADRNNSFVLGHSSVSNYQFRGVNYVFPASAVAGTLISDASGVLSWSTNLSVSVTNATPPGDTANIKAWINVILSDGSVFKSPLYQ